MQTTVPRPGMARILGWSHGPALLAGVALASLATAGELYTIMPGSSRAAFHAHATGHDFSGISTDVRGHLRFDPGSPEAGATGEVLVQANTLDTDISRRNRKMWGLLETTQFRDIVFTLRGVELGDPLPGFPVRQATLDGSLEVRGAQNPLKIPAHVQVDVGIITATGVFELDIRTFGIDPPRAFLVRMDPVVRVEFEVRFQAAN